MIRAMLVPLVLTMIPLSSSPTPAVPLHCPMNATCFYSGKNWTGHKVTVRGPVNKRILFLKYRFDDKTKSWANNFGPPQACGVVVFGGVQLLWDEGYGQQAGYVGSADADQATWFQIVGCG